MHARWGAGGGGGGGGGGHIALGLAAHAPAGPLSNTREFLENSLVRSPGVPGAQNSLITSFLWRRRRKRGPGPACGAPLPLPRQVAHLGWGDPPAATSPPVGGGPAQHRPGLEGGWDVAPGRGWGDPRVEGTPPPLRACLTGQD